MELRGLKESLEAGDEKRLAEPHLEPVYQPAFAVIEVDGPHSGAMQLAVDQRNHRLAEVGGVHVDLGGGAGLSVESRGQLSHAPGDLGEPGTRADPLEEADDEVISEPPVVLLSLLHLDGTEAGWLLPLPYIDAEDHAHRLLPFAEALIRRS